jgi:serine/threonine protein kinase
VNALCYLHGKGLAHLDIKLENIVIVNGVAKLIDFEGLWNTNNPSGVIACTMQYRPPGSLLII